MLHTGEHQQHEHCRIAHMQMRSQCAAAFGAFRASDVTPSFLQVDASNSPSAYELNILHVIYQVYRQNHTNQILKQHGQLLYLRRCSDDKTIELSYCQELNLCIPSQEWCGQWKTSVSGDQPILYIYTVLSRVTCMKTHLYKITD